MIVPTFWPIFAAALSSVILAMVWYHPKVFGGPWMRFIGLTPEMAERGKRRMPLMALLALLASMLVAWVMSYVGILLGVYDWFGALELGFWCWLGFTAPPMLGMVLWEQKPVRYYLIVSLYWLVAFMLMAEILLLGSQLVGGTQYSDTTDSGYSASE